MINKTKDYLTTPNAVKISNKNVNNINFDNILAFSYGGPGAMGEPGHLIIVEKNKRLKFYESNLVYNKDEELIDKLFHIFPKEFEESLVDSGFLPDLDGWKEIDLGMGNSLCIREEYYSEFNNLVNRVDIYNLCSRGMLFRIRREVLNLFFNKNLKIQKDKLELTTPSILGAIVGDVVGSRFEFHPHRSKNFELFSKNDCFDKDGKLTLGYFIKGCRFTDDSVMTLAIANALMECKGDFDNLSDVAIKYMKEYGRKYPLVGYGNNFNRWIMLPNAEPYNSFGNGSAMRISAVPYFADDLEELKDLVCKVTNITHNHPEGIKGACAVADCIWLALRKYNKDYIKRHIEENYYQLDFDYEDLVKNYRFDETCQGSVPQSIFAFLISDSFEDTIRTAVSMGGDADTMGAIAGAIAGAYYGVPNKIKEKVKEFLSTDLLQIVEDFDSRFYMPKIN